MTKWIAALAACLALAACTSSGSPSPSTGGTHTIVHTLTPSAPVYTPPRAATVHPLPYGASAPKGQKDGRCPYIKAGLNQTDNTGVNLADLEGDRVYRTTLLTKYRPVGCRFYFYAGPYEAIADIRPYTFANFTDAHNAMVRTATADGKETITEKDFVPGVDGICFRTKYFGPDGFKDWAFVFAKGKHMVVVYTQRKDTSRNALYIGKAIAAKF